jgi:hypothetical protein
MCGTVTGTNGTSTQTNGKHAPGINTFELQEDLKSRNVRATVTDHAIAHMGEALAAILAERITTRPRPPQRTIEHVDTTPPLLPPPPAANAPQEVTATPPSTSPPQGTDQQRLHQIFEYDGEEIRLQEDDLKAESGQDYARRLTYLFLLAHETEGRKPIAYESLKRILDTAKIWDNNTRHALTHKMAVEIEGTMVRLKGAGRKQALTALDEILNPSNTTPGWTPENKTRTSKQLAEKTAKGKPGRKRSTQAETWAGQWEKHAEHTNGHFALKGKPIHDKAALALWAIHKVGGKAASAGLVQRFIKAAFSYDEKPRSIINALARKDDLFLKVEGGYKLTPTGNKHAEAIAKK